MKKLLLPCLFLLLVHNRALAADNQSPVHGEKMHNNHCFKCHTDQVYTRDNRFVKTLNALGKQVERCKNNTGVPWFDEDTEAVVDFLNTRYYKF